MVRLKRMTTRLKDLHIIALDCQTTGANPNRGHLLEIGWVSTCSSENQNPEDLRPEAYLVKLPDAHELPRTVQRITGITEKDLVKATDAQNIWRKLDEAARNVSASNQSEPCPLVIHFSRFEEPFLRDLHIQSDAGRAFPFQLICTHEIARRLLPGLPRRGLRAIAGYFGHPVPELRRSADHAVATAFIWKKMITLLENDTHIETLEQLINWLQNAAPRTNSKRTYPMEPDIRRGLPARPGVYRMLRGNGDILYIGKAKSLKQRVNSYFRQTGSCGDHILEMLTQAYNLDYTLTGSALEAAIFENDEIKTHSPPYNVALRKGQRILLWCTKDLAHFTDNPDKNHPIGPLPGGNMAYSLAAFVSLTAKNIDPVGEAFEKTVYALLGIPMSHRPEEICLREGFEIFQQRHARWLLQGQPLRILTGLGAVLWREHLERREQDRTEQAEISESIESQSETDNPVWYPEDVARAIEGVIRQAAYLIRRSRWLCLISESTLAWSPSSAGEGHKRVLYLNEGAVVRCEYLDIQKMTPVPAGHATPPRQRRRNIDLTTYDRLRVVTTELRRLVSETRRIELRLGPAAMMGNQELERALRWV
jgi:DNA polymerase-3 subunit epsilon